LTLARESRKASRDDRQEKREAILAALARATEDGRSLSAGAADTADEDNYYYTLSHEEIEALITGNIEKIESWVSSLDRRHATWLLRRLIKESW
jgi:hypothetical protein